MMFSQINGQNFEEIKKQDRVFEFQKNGILIYMVSKTKILFHII